MCKNHVQTGSGCLVDCEAEIHLAGGGIKESLFRKKGIPLAQMVVE